MSSLKKLKEDRASVIDEMNAIVKLAESEDRNLTEDEKSEFDTKDTESNDYQERIDRLQRSLDLAANPVVMDVQSGSKDDTKSHKRYSLLKAINEFSNGGSLTGIEAEMHIEAQRNNPLNGLGVPMWLMSENRADTGPQTQSDGAKFVRTDVSDYGATLQSRMVLGDLATYFYGLNGNLNVPVLADTSASWVAEGSAPGDDAQTDPGGVTLAPKRLSANMAITRALMSVGGSVENAIREDLLNAVAAQVEYGALSGSGSSGQPTGVFALSGTGSVADGAATLAAMVELESDVAGANADFGRLAYITSPAGRGKLKQVLGVPYETSGAGAPLWFNNEINGYAARATSNVLNTYGTGSDGAGVVFGRWDDCVIASFGDAMDLIVDPYSGAKSGLITIVVNSNWDVQFKRATSFSTMEGIAL